MISNNYTYEYPRPAVTTDCVIFGFDGMELKVLLIERANDPCKGKWAFPGGFLEMNENADDGAKRELFEETGLTNVFIEQLYTFNDVDRDPRGRVISIAYFALVNTNSCVIKAGDDAKNAKWFSIHEIPSLAFDHDMIFRMAHNRLKSKIRYQPVGFELLDECFTIPELQRLYEAILGVQFDRRNFSKKIRSTDLLIETEPYEGFVKHKAAKCYKFNNVRYDELSKRGFNFEI